MTEALTDAPVVSRPPRDNLVRAVRPGIELRADSADGMPTLTGHFAVFNEWTEINSLWEGNFLERIMPGAFTKAFQEPARSGIRPLFQHGRDFTVGDKPLGPIEVLREDETGAYYEVPLLDTSYNRDLIPGLRAGLYGASFRFRVTREEFDKKPKASAYNPQGIPERSVRELELYEFGPVTFPAYAGATAGIRSLTDEFALERFAREPGRLQEVLRFLNAPSQPGAAPSGHPGAERSERGARIFAMSRAAEGLDESIQAVDAAIDEAIEELQASDGNPDQALALLQAADTVIDQLMEDQGIPDPDDPEEPGDVVENALPQTADAIAASKDRQPAPIPTDNREAYLTWIAAI